MCDIQSKVTLKAEMIAYAEEKKKHETFTESMRQDTKKLAQLSFPLSTSWASVISTEQF